MLMVPSDSEATETAMGEVTVGIAVGVASKEGREGKEEQEVRPVG